MSSRLWKGMLYFFIAVVATHFLLMVKLMKKVTPTGAVLAKNVE